MSASTNPALAGLNLPPGSFSIPNVASGMLFEMFIAAGLTGIIMMQSYIYFLYSAPKDSMFMRVFSTCLVLFELLHTIFSSHALFTYLVIDFGNVLELTKFIWSTGIAFFLSTVIVAMVQIVYIRRLWLLTNQIILPFLLSVVLFLRAVMIGFLFHYEDWLTFYSTKAISCIYAALGLTVASDVMIAIVQFRHRSQTKTKFKEPNDTIGSLLKYIFRGWIVSGAVSLGSLIAFIVDKNSWTWIGLGVISIKLYATSLFSSFNAHRSIRHKIAKAHSTGVESFEPMSPPARIEILREISAVSDNHGLKVSNI
ncbi:hypothetical protein C8Q75DRAFT_48988 [Abortiporus biennis]|nr:hypothetical protein C8Q75DRAFT_48988 [Abortiporus biennis]